MISTFFEGHEHEFRWIDIADPTAPELNAAAREHGLHHEFVTDVMQPEHLPKYEAIGETCFFILRYYSLDGDGPADTIQALTNKVAIFQKADLLITVHLHKVPFLEELRDQLKDDDSPRKTSYLLNRMLKAVLRTFEPPASELAAEIDQYEEKTFLKRHRHFSLSGVYHVRRKIEVSRMTLNLTKDILEIIDHPDHQDPETRDTRDLYVRLRTLYESMAENTNQLLTVHFAIAAQHTNQVIRILTLFSVFFMPLTFIVGLYGMNFHHMPELDWRYGYPAIIALMGVVTLVIFLWFKKRGWL